MSFIQDVVNTFKAAADVDKYGNGTNAEARHCAGFFIGSCGFLAYATWLLASDGAPDSFVAFLYAVSVILFVAWRFLHPKVIWRWQIQKTLYGSGNEQSKH
jgi:hypothetical protein